jgi:hypothetical protein
MHAETEKSFKITTRPKKLKRRSVSQTVDIVDTLIKVGGER